MKNLIKADLFKEFHKRNFKYVICFLILFMFIFYLLVSNNLKGKQVNVYPQLMSENEYFSVNKYGSYKEYKEKYYKYQESMNIKNEINSSSSYNKSVEIINNSVVLFYLVGVIVIFISYHSLSYDYNKGLIRYVFMSNKERWKIFFSKIISLFIISLLLVSIIIVGSSFFSSIFGKEFIFLVSKTIYFNSKFVDISLLSYLIMKAIVYLIPILFMIILSLFICILFNGKNLGLTLLIIIYVMGASLMGILLNYNVSLVSYLPISYMDFTYFEDGSYLLNNAIYNSSISIKMSLIVLSIYNIISVILSLILFNRDV